MIYDMKLLRNTRVWTISWLSNNSPLLYDFGPQSLKCRNVQSK